MYAVVTLEDPKEVMVAASDWLSLDKTRCYWPPFKSAEKCTEAVRNRLEPSTSGKPWEILNIHFHGEYATFEQATKRQEEIKQRARILATGLIKRQKLEQNQGMSKNLFNPPSVPSTSTSKMPTDDKDEILQMLREIKSKVHENSTMLKKLLKDKPVSDSAPSSTSMPSKVIKTNLKLPLQSIEDVFRTERELKNATRRKKYVKYLSGLGGFGQKDVIKNIMQHLLTDDLAKEFNWQGRGEKRPFSHLVLVDVIKDAASKHTITRGDCETEIKKYLSYTADRISRKRPREVGSGPEISDEISYPFLDSASQSQFETPIII